MAHFYTRAESGLPLTGRQPVRSLRKYPLYQKIISNLDKGGSVADAFSTLKLPPFYLEIIRQGERSGKLAEAFKILLDYHPVLSAFEFQLRGVRTYAALVLGFFLVFLFYFSSVYMASYEELMVMTSGQMPRIPVFIRVFSSPYLFWIVFAGLFFLTLALNLMKRPGPVSFLIRKIPLVKKNYDRIISLEIGALYQYGLELGMTPRQVLGEAVGRIGDFEVKEALQKAMAMVEKGAGVGEALGAQSRLASLPVVEAVRLGESSGMSGAIMGEANTFTRSRLDTTLEKDMRKLFRWLAVFCGLLTALGVISVIQAIIESYSWLVS